jgi:flagellar hook-basal body complex protein FliE
MIISPVNSVGINLVKDIDSLSKAGGITGNIDKSGQSEKSFMSTIMDSIKNVQQTQAEANTKVGQLVSGKDTDLAGVLIAAEKASLEMQFTLQIRNKLLEAYQEITRMQV